MSAEIGETLTGLFRRISAARPSLPEFPFNVSEVADRNAGIVLKINKTSCGHYHPTNDCGYYLCTFDAQLTCYLKGALDLCLNPATRSHRENLQRHRLSDYSSLHAGLFVFCSNLPGTLGGIAKKARFPRACRLLLRRCDQFALYATQDPFADVRLIRPEGGEGVESGSELGQRRRPGMLHAGGTPDRRDQLGRGG